MIIKNVVISIGDITVNLNEGLLVKRKKSSLDSASGGTNKNEVVSSVDSVSTNEPSKKQQTLARYTAMFPEKVSFDLPKLDVSLSHREYGLSVENNIMGIQLKINKFRSTENAEEITHLDFQLVLSEIHLLREAGSSMLEILKLDVVSFVCVPVQSLSSPVRAEIEINLGGLRCNIILSRLKRWLLLHVSKKKRMVLREEPPPPPVVAKPKSTNSNTGFSLMWKCKFSAPEMTIMVFDMAGSPVYHGCLQSPHMFANNTSNMGTAAHVELDEFSLRLADEYEELLKGRFSGAESINPGSIMQITKVSLDWGKMDLKASEEADPKFLLGLSVVVSSMEVYLSLQRLESLISAAVTFQVLLKRLSASKKKSTPPSQRTSSSKPSGKGTQTLRFNLEQCSVYVLGETSLDNTVIPDPKRVNYGSQGGKVVVTVSADGKPRTAEIISTVSGECENIKYSVFLEILNFKLCRNKEKQSTQMELERIRSVYKEYMEGNDPVMTVDLFNMQSAKFVQRSKENGSRSLFSTTDITVRWEPDVHISIIDLTLQLKSLVHNTKLQEQGNDHVEDSLHARDDATSESSGNLEKKPKKKDSIFAVDVEMLNISAGLGDGVEAVVQVPSIFSENARIGVLLEGLVFSFNGARIVKSSRMQISRIPSKAIPTAWDWVIQGLDVQIILPYRLQLRAIDDALEYMLRALKLIINAKTSLIFPVKKESSSKVKKPGSAKFGCVKVLMRKLAIDIEEEPLQGWLDEHYLLLKKEAGELAVRLNFLEEFSSKDKQDPKPTDDTTTTSTNNNSLEVETNDSSTVDSMREEIYKRSFKSYYDACQKLVPAKGSGACDEFEFQAGFKPSASRFSLMSISATDLDVSLTKIEGGEDGMIEVVRKLDPVCLEYDIPFSRVYGANLSLNTGSLLVTLRNYTFPLFAGSNGKCDGRLVLAQQATSFQPQQIQDVNVGRYRKVFMLRSATGTTPPIKTFLDLPLHFQKGHVSYGVSYEPVFTDISYAFTVAMRRANLSAINPGPLVLPPKKEKSLPWWDEMRNYIHGKISLLFSHTEFNILATTDPYEKVEKLQIVTNSLEIHQSDGQVLVSAQNFRILLSSLENLANRHGVKIPAGIAGAFLEAPAFALEVTMDWDCDSGTPLNHFLFSLPIEGKAREFVFDPFRSTSLKLGFHISFRSDNQSPTSTADHRNDLLASSPVIRLGAHDLAWIIGFWNLNYLPPNKIRFFSRWPRFGVPRVPRSGNLSMDKVMTEFMIRIDSTPLCIKNTPMHDDDPAKGLTFMMNKFKFELYFSRGEQKKYYFDSKRELLIIVYQGIDLHMPKVFLDREEQTSIAKLVNMAPKSSQSASEDKITPDKDILKKKDDMIQKSHDDGFILSGDYFTVRRQSPKADSASLVAWRQEAGKRNNVEITTNVKAHHSRNESEVTDDHSRTSDPSDDDDGYNVVIADNCWRVFVYGLKILWNIENRDAFCSFAAGLSKAFQPSKPSPSRRYQQRRLLEEKKLLEESKQHDDGGETNQDGNGAESEKNQVNGANANNQDEVAECRQDVGVETHEDAGGETGGDDGGAKITQQDEVSKSLPVTGNVSDSPPSSQIVETSGSVSSPPHIAQVDNLSPPGLLPAKDENTKDQNDDDDEEEEEEGTRHFMVNVIEPQFNLHSEDANGRFLLAAASGRVLAQSFHSVLRVGTEMIAQALEPKDIDTGESQSEVTWKRMEMSVMLEHVQAHVAPTDVDLGAGVQWLPKIRRGSPKVMRTGALLERVFMPCDMFFQYTRHKADTPEMKVKPLKELKFNSQNITATMTSRQFQVMLDVLNNLLFARLPKARKSSMSLSVEDDDVLEEESDEVVPDGIEEVELERINLEKKERAQKLILEDIRKLSLLCDSMDDSQQLEKEGDLWMIGGGRAMLVQGLKRELVSAQKSRKEACASLRTVLKKAANQRLLEKEKNKSPSYAMRIYLQINKVVWSMLLDGKPFAEAEICDMIYDFDRDFKDVGISLFTTKYVIFRNCLPSAKSDMLLSAWNPPPEWGKKVLLRVEAKQAAPKDGSSPFELFQVDIYPLKIHLTETMYRMMWGYFFPEEERDSSQRREVWKTTAGARRPKKGSSVHEASASTKESDASSKSATVQASKAEKAKANPGTGSNPELKRSSSFDRTWEENMAESVADEFVQQSLTSSKNTIEQQDEATKTKSKDSKGAKSGHSSQEEKKATKSNEEKRPKKMVEFHNIKISQVELCVTYEGQRFAVNDMKLLMDQFHRVEFVGTWRRLFSRVKKHIIWGVLKSVAGMQGKKFKDKGDKGDKGQSQPSGAGVPEIDQNFSDKDGHAGKSDQLPPPSWPKRPVDGAGDGFVTSVKGIFNTQRRKAKKFVMKTMKGEAEHESHGHWSENDADIPFARQLTIVKAKHLIKGHKHKHASKGEKGSSSEQKEQLPQLSLDIADMLGSDSSSGSSSEASDE